MPPYTVVANIVLLPEVPAGSLKIVVIVTLLLGATTTLVNLSAAILGIVALNKPAISKAFRRGA